MVGDRERGRVLCEAERKSGGVYYRVGEETPALPLRLCRMTQLDLLRGERTLAAMLRAQGNQRGTRAYKSQWPGPAVFPPSVGRFRVSRGLNGRMSISLAPCPECSCLRSHREVLVGAYRAGP